MMAQVVKGCLENLFVATAISDEKRQRALLLYYAGEEASEIFDILPDTGEDFETARMRTLTRRRMWNLRYTRFGRRSKTQVKP